LRHQLYPKTHTLIHIHRIHLVCDRRVTQQIGWIWIIIWSAFLLHEFGEIEGIETEFLVHIHFINLQCCITVYILKMQLHDEELQGKPPNTLQ
jgi:hypothetical protein